MNRLKGKHVLITGASSGIGKSCAFQFAEQGANLILTSRRNEKLQEISNQIANQYGVKVHIAAFDIQDYQKCEAFVNNLEVEIDILINNAGLALGVDAIDKVNPEDWNTMIDTNVKGVLNLSRLISPKFRKRNQGHIINISSTAAHEAYSGGVIYCATKHAVKAITEATKKDFHGTNVRVSMVSPGLVETDFSNVRFKGDFNKAGTVYKGLKPLNGDDVAEIVVFVANRPDHVNIMDTMIYPVNQSSPTMVYRDE